MMTNNKQQECSSVQTWTGPGWKDDWLVKKGGLNIRPNKSWIVKIRIRPGSSLVDWIDFLMKFKQNLLDSINFDEKSYYCWFSLLILKNMS